MRTKRSFLARLVLAVIASLLLSVPAASAHGRRSHGHGHRHASRHGTRRARKADDEPSLGGELEVLTATELAEVEREVEEEPDPMPYPEGEEVTVAAEPA